MDWRSFVERQSRMEAVLREDPSGFYRRMTFATRDQLPARGRADRAADPPARGEPSPGARSSCARAGRRTRGAPDDRAPSRTSATTSIDDGLAELERADRLPARRRARRSTAGCGAIRTSSSSAASPLATLAALAAVLWLGGSEARAAWLAVLLLGLIPANDIAVNVVNQLVTAFLPPRTLPKLDLHEHGVPPEFRTAVVIPTLFGSVDAVREALENLEVQFLANREAHLHFAVLSDFTDAPTETREDDDAIVAAAVEGVRALNARYAAGTRGRVLPLPPPPPLESARGRVDGVGAEAGQARRVQPVRAGRRARAPSPSIVGDLEPIRSVRYVITLDADTVLPPDAAPLLVGALAHPLNRAVYDPDARPRGARLRHPAAAGRRLAAERAPLALRGDPLGTSRRGPLHHRGLRRLPGPLRRGELHRQGHLRRRRVRAGDARPLPREHAALARPDRGELRARRPRHRRDRLRRLPDPLPHLHPAQAPLDPGRLAAAALAHRDGCRARTAPSPTGSRSSRAGRSSTTCAAARWRSRQLVVPGRRLDAASRLAAPLDPARPRRDRGALDRVAPARGAPPAARQVVARLLRRGGPRRGHQRAAVRAWPSSSCRTRPGSRPTRSCARSGACSCPGGTCSSGRRRRRPSAA